MLGRCGRAYLGLHGDRALCYKVTHMSSYSTCQCSRCITQLFWLQLFLGLLSHLHDMRSVGHAQRCACTTLRSIGHMQGRACAALNTHKSEHACG